MSLDNFKVSISRDLAPWPRHHPFFWRQMKIGTLTYLLREPRSNSKHTVRSFFEKHYDQDPDPFVFDGAVNDYLSQMHPLLFELTQPTTVIDLGCGQGGLYHFLKNKDFTIRKYFGLDFALPPRMLHDNARTIRIDFGDPETIHLLEDKTAVFAVNTLCYIRNIEAIPLVEAAAQKAGNRLLIIEPWPGVFWDRYFDGIRPVYRFPRQLIENLQDMAWIPQRQINFYYTSILGCYLLPLSYGIVFSSRG